MLNKEEFAKDYKEYANLNKLEVSDDIINKKYNEYKKETPESSKVDDTSVLSMKPKSSLNIKISKTLEEIKKLRELKKSEGDKFADKKALQELLKEIKLLRDLKKKEK